MSKPIEELFNEWLDKHEYSYKELNPYCPENGYQFPNSFLSSASKYFEGGYKLKEKHAIKAERRYEDFYICGDDLFDAFKAGYELSKKEK